MARQVRSRTTFRRLQPIFATQDLELGPLLARMSVLYEDLRIELHGATDGSIERLDGNTPIYRKFYFLRRSTITLVEFRGTLQRLCENGAFKQVRERFDPEQEKRWQAANDFFSLHHGLLKSVRNDCGGHFRLATAIDVVRNHLDSDTSGSMEVDFGPLGDDVTVYMKFSYEFVAAALTIQKPANEDLQVFARRLFEIVREGWIHIVQVMHAPAKSLPNI